MGILTLISNAFAAVKEYFGWAKQHSEVNNAPDMKAAAIAKQEQGEHDQEIKDVAARDVEKTRKDLAE